MHPLGARTREDMKERIMDRTQYTNLAKAWEFTEEHARERESDALTDTRTAADESGQLQGSAAQARLLGMLVRITGRRFGDCRGHRLAGGDLAARPCWITRAC